MFCHVVCCVKCGKIRTTVFRTENSGARAKEEWRFMMFMTFAKRDFASFERYSHRWTVDPAPVGFHCEALATRQALANGGGGR